ncbi:hypothetical protein BYT27DRAFT_7013988, partial [Phlegmacium glaucopus]
QYAMSLMRTLYQKHAQEGDNITEHLNKLKEIWERLNILNNESFSVTDTQFKTIVATSLPESWDPF